jgi:protease secretion system outer membrane protein
VDFVATRTDNHYYETTGDDDTWSNSYVLQLELPIYSGGRTSALEEEAQALSRQAKHELTTTQHGVMSELQQQYEESRLHLDRIALNKESQREAKKLLKFTRKAFKAGNRSNIDVLNAQQQVTDVSGELIKSRVDYLRAQAQILRLLGKLSDYSILEQFDSAILVKP